MKVLLLVFALAASACSNGGVPTTAPSPGVLSGAWSGESAPNYTIVGNSLVTAFIGQRTDGLFAGTFEAHFANPIHDYSGSVLGGVDGAQVTLTFTPSVAGHCPEQYLGTLTGSVITGTTLMFNCSPDQTGTFMLTKQ
ncbi:MAG TPA: hypothetical protein VKR23_16145 [Gaiellaceae bacterium]|nr:hypothetical protein [Gaiellaceae bacterium]